MYNLHPFLSSLPVGLFMLIGALELVQLVRPRPALHSTITINVVAAAVATSLAFISGYQGQALANGSFKIDQEVIHFHHAIGRLLLFVAVPCAALRVIADRAEYHKRTFYIAYAIALFVCIGLTLYAGYLGGALVFQLGAGVTAPVGG